MKQYNMYLQYSNLVVQFITYYQVIFCDNNFSWPEFLKFINKFISKPVHVSNKVETDN